MISSLRRTVVFNGGSNEGPTCVASLNQVRAQVCHACMGDLHALSASVAQLRPRECGSLGAKPGKCYVC